MATRKVDAEPISEEAVKPAAKEYSWEDMREVYLPKAHGNEEKSLYVAVNGRAFQVPKGVKTMVPYPIYETINLMLDAEDAAQDLMDSIPDKQ